jgi:hypothetical protein
MFSHGPQAGQFEYELYASLPKDRNKKAPVCSVELAAKHGLEPADVGTIDGACFVRFLWRIAGRPCDAGDDWVRLRPLVVALDNYSVHKSQPVKEALPALAAADVHLFYLPAYSPELSDIEPVWQDTKHHRLVRRSYEILGQLKLALTSTLKQKAQQLLDQRQTYRLTIRPA